MLEIMQPKYQEATLPERAKMQFDYLRVLSASTGISLTCVDSNLAKNLTTRTGLLSEAWHTDTNREPSDTDLLKLLSKVTPDDVIKIEDCSQEEAEQLLIDIEKEIREGRFDEVVGGFLAQRMSSDDLIARSIEEHRQGAAIGIFGKAHVAPERTDSLVTALQDMNVRVSAFHIAAGKIIPARPAGAPAPSLETSSPKS